MQGHMIDASPGETFGAFFLPFLLSSTPVHPGQCTRAACRVLRGCVRLCLAALPRLLLLLRARVLPCRVFDVWFGTRRESHRRGVMSLSQFSPFRQLSWK